MAVLYESHTSPDDIGLSIHGDNAVAQTFAASESHVLREVDLKLSSNGTGGLVTVSLRLTDGDGAPTGADLCSGTIDGTALGTTAAWRTITLTPYSVIAGVTYAIVLVCSAPNVLNAVACRADGDGGYSGGAYASSSDGGVTWASIRDYTILFKESGDPLLGCLNVPQLTRRLNVRATLGNSFTVKQYQRRLDVRQQPRELTLEQYARDLNPIVRTC